MQNEYFWIVVIEAVERVGKSMVMQYNLNSIFARLKINL